MKRLLSPRTSSSAAGTSDHFVLAQPDFFLTYYINTRLRKPSGLPFSVIISRSKDGEIIARIVERIGGNCVRGSTSKRGTSALHRLIELAEQNHSLIITPDGPRGPRYRVQPGAAKLAQKTNLPVVPATYGVTDYTRFDSWDQFILPHPFSRATVLFGSPVKPEQYNSLSPLQNELQKQMIQLEQELITLGFQNGRPVRV